jgi:GrpB-like predicted nucleotidyltransferase (UPF0157 family)
MVQVGGEFWERHLLFRDFLRANAEVRQQYASLKKHLAEREWESTNEYAAAKTDFVRMAEAQARSQTI